MFRAYVGGEGRRRPRGLRHWVLHLLDRRPLNGAEIMEQMDQMTRGLWRPSPGSIYPLLEQLAADGLVRRGEDGRYSLTPLAKEAPPWMMAFAQGAGAARDPEGALHELEAHLRFLEDIVASDPARVAPFRERLTEIGRRLDRLVSGARAGPAARGGTGGEARREA
jgi:DNA-binding PadR family transcriptional regulator